MEAGVMRENGFSWSAGKKRRAQAFDLADLDPGIVFEGGLWHVQTAWASTWRRYRGSSLDDLRFVGLAHLGDGFDCGLPGFEGYWSGAIWADSGSGKWYTVVHVEYGRAGEAHARKLMLATSTDRGATWDMVGDILTHNPIREGRPEPREDYIDFGDGDPKLFVDERGGYFYLYYMVGWSRISEYGDPGRYMCVARCAIADKMMPGCWRKWHMGAWTQPGLEGDADFLWPVPSGNEAKAVPVIFYCEPLDRYLAVAKGWASSCVDLQTQNWTAKEYGFSDALLNYNWVVDVELQSRFVVGRSFRLYSSQVMIDQVESGYIDITVQKL